MSTTKRSHTLSAAAHTNRKRGEAFRIETASVEEVCEKSWQLEHRNGVERSATGFVRRRQRATGPAVRRSEMDGKRGCAEEAASDGQTPADVSVSDRRGRIDFGSRHAAGKTFALSSILHKRKGRGFESNVEVLQLSTVEQRILQLKLMENEL
ncbi:unnamed protein product [Caenorhabditis auriculariae]|uniref:Uncharacterized protein n=1 Tax=Caenorhabditis auriculariae TaxID=2777116 RepID=A0A8S1GTU6_9PELO|nr:unnamed protein product [Caenorhabditis auriculariae]